ncbi:NrsF family protein [Vreelandella titanicae]|uniref:DUF1109 family protein n=1 Tax=Vreelandella titanicae TaxID=664683 RepID=A0A558JFC8_9GAMM|nr:DUF1109 domain-containing protein [Halomonas titanicae]TVU92344.1 DUF1109 family protein [Halomonas titanicae]
MKTDDLIELLSQDQTSHWSLGRTFALALLGGVLISSALFVMAVGVRSDINAAIETLRVILKFVFSLALAVSSFKAVKHLARPDTYPVNWLWGALSAYLLLILAAGFELMVVPRDLWGERLVGNNALDCLMWIPVLSLAPLIAIMMAIRKGATTRPGLTGALAGFSASGIAAVLYALHCPDDSPLFVMIWYSIATVSVACVGYFGGRFFLKW